MGKTGLAEKYDYLAQREIPVLIPFEQVQNLGMIEIYKQVDNLVYLIQDSTKLKFCFNINEIR